MSEIEKRKELKRLETQANKAAAVISELEWKIIEREEDIERMRVNIEQQRKIKADSEVELERLKEK